MELFSPILLRLEIAVAGNSRIPLPASVASTQPEIADKWQDEVAEFVVVVFMQL
jgi:hypothetical protein